MMSTIPCWIRTIKESRSFSEGLVSTSLSYAIKELDIDDDEIMSLWKSCPAEHQNKPGGNKLMMYVNM